MPEPDQEAATEDAPRPIIEIGWVLAGPVEALTAECAEDAMGRLLAFAGESWPAFEWRQAVVTRQRRGAEHVVEPTALLDLGLVELDAAHWDFVFVVTDAELRTHEKPFALGTPARSYGVAVLSTARLAPPARGKHHGQERAALAQRLFPLAAHELG